MTTAPSDPATTFRSYATEHELPPAVLGLLVRQVDGACVFEANAPTVVALAGGDAVRAVEIVTELGTQLRAGLGVPPAPTAAAPPAPAAPTAAASRSYVDRTDLERHELDELAARRMSRAMRLTSTATAAATLLSLAGTGRFGLELGLGQLFPS